MICYDEALVKTGRAPGNLLHWRSGRMHRVVNSTLAAEAQSMSRGLQELAWTVTVYNELVQKDFDLQRWNEEAKKRRLVAMSHDGANEKLQKSLCLVDAKSLFDHLIKTTIGSTEDRRTAIEMQCIRQLMQEVGATVKWIRHEQMLVDCLTKRVGNKAPLYQFLKSGCLDLIVVVTNRNWWESVKRGSPKEVHLVTTNMCWHTAYLFSPRPRGALTVRREKAAFACFGR